MRATGPQGKQECNSADAYADDLILLTSCHLQMIEQIRKVQAFCAWTGMSLNPQKSELSAVLHGAAAAGPATMRHTADD